MVAASPPRELEQGDARLERSVRRSPLAALVPGTDHTARRAKTCSSNRSIAGIAHAATFKNASFFFIPITAEIM